MGGERRRAGRWRGPWRGRAAEVVGAVGELGAEGEQAFVHAYEEAGEAAAIGDDRVGEFVPEGSVALAGREAEILADVDDDGADRAATQFGGDFGCGGEAREARVLGGVGGLGLGLGVARRDLAFRARFARGRHAHGRRREVLAALGALAQPGLQGRGETQAVGDAGEDDGEVDGAKGFGEVAETGGAGALLDCGGDLLAEVDQSADDAEDAAEGGGHGWGGPRRIGVGRRDRGVGGGGHERM
jgi:hypothetical protein